MKNIILISIIIPVFNTEKYLRRCLNSVISINAEKEIIVIDDGSTDKSTEICDEYEKNYSCIKVVHQENQGVSVARNKGLDIAKGEYIFFVDSDDYIDEGFIEDFFLEEAVDFVYAGFTEENQNGERYRIVQYEECVQTVEELRKNFTADWTKTPFLFVHGACYRNDIIQKFYLRFDVSIKMGEDTRFNIKYLEHCTTYAIIRSSKYIYCNNPESTIHRLHVDRLEKEMEECMLLEKFSEIDEQFERMKWIHWHTVIQHYRHYLKVNEDVITKKMLKKRLKEAFHASYFRDSIKYIKKSGSLDEKVECYLMNYYMYDLHKIMLQILAILSEIKMELLNIIGRR